MDQRFHRRKGLFHCVRHGARLGYGARARLESVVTVTTHED